MERLTKAQWLKVGLLLLGKLAVLVAIMMYKEII
jgi:hypothetical protein